MCFICAFQSICCSPAHQHLPCRLPPSRIAVLVCCCRKSCPTEVNEGSGAGSHPGLAAACDRARLSPQARRLPRAAACWPSSTRPWTARLWRSGTRWMTLVCDTSTARPWAFSRRQWTGSGERRIMCPPTGTSSSSPECPCYSASSARRPRPGRRGRTRRRPLRRPPARASRCARLLRASTVQGRLQSPPLVVRRALHSRLEHTMPGMRSPQHDRLTLVLHPHCDMVSRHSRALRWGARAITLPQHALACPGAPWNPPSSPLKP